MTPVMDYLRSSVIQDLQVPAALPLCQCGGKPVVERNADEYCRRVEFKATCACCGTAVQAESPEELKRLWAEELKYGFVGDY